VVLVAGFATDLDYSGYKGELSSFFKEEINWEKILKVCNKFVSISSDNDPYVPLKHNALFVRNLKAESVVMHNMNHFSGDDGVLQLPEALTAVLKISGTIENR
jgi:predicted alpha/beta hydrolase family esterase